MAALKFSSAEALAGLIWKSQLPDLLDTRSKTVTSESKPPLFSHISIVKRRSFCVVTSMLCTSRNEPIENIVVIIFMDSLLKIANVRYSAVFKLWFLLILFNRLLHFLPYLLLPSLYPSISKKVFKLFSFGFRQHHIYSNTSFCIESLP